MNIRHYWKACLEQNALKIETFFHEDAYVNWHNTNEHFTVREFIRANCEYPGAWDGEVERVEEIGELVITVTHVFSQDQKLSFHVTSFIQMRDGKIAGIDEYWGDDGLPPQWRREKCIGSPLKAV